MRLAVCALSAVLLSGCSWLGMGGKAAHTGAGGAYGGCAPTACADGSYGYGGYGQAYGQPGAAAYGAASGYGAGVQGAQYAGYGQSAGVAGAGYGAGGLNGYGAYGGQGVGGGVYSGQGIGGGVYGAQGVGGPAAVGYQGAYGVPGQVGVVGGQGAFGNGTVTTLGGAAPYGAATVGGLRTSQGIGGGVFGQNVVGAQYANGQFVGGQAVRTVQGAPIYVPQPYGVPYGVGVGGGVAAAALPFGLSLLGGTDFDVSGDLFTKDGGPAVTGFDADGNEILSADTNVGVIDLAYDDVFDESRRIGLALERDINPSTTIFGQGSYSKADGNFVENYTTVQTGGAFDADGNFIPGTDPERGIDADFGDLEVYTAELGVRKYLGAPTGIRPYVGASAGASYNNSVDYRQTYNDDGTVYAETVELIDSGWNPTAAGIIGAELPVGHRGAIGIESGVRWTDGLDLPGADDRIQVPVTLRGRVAF